MRHCQLIANKCTEAIKNIHTINKLKKNKKKKRSVESAEKPRKFTWRTCRRAKTAETAKLNCLENCKTLQETGQWQGKDVFEVRLVYFLTKQYFKHKKFFGLNILTKSQNGTKKNFWTKQIFFLHTNKKSFGSRRKFLDKKNLY